MRLREAGPGSATSKRAREWVPWEGDRDGPRLLVDTTDTGKAVEQVAALLDG